MSFDLEFRAALAVVLLGFVAHRGYHLRKGRTGSEESAARTATRQWALPFRTDQPQMAALLAIPSFLVTLVYLFEPEAVAWASFPAPAWLRWSGAVVALAGFVLLSWAQRSLGRQWSDASRLLLPQHALIDSGPYRRIAHPIYTSFLLIFGSTLPLSANLVVGLLWISTTAAEIFPRIRREEALLFSRFGERYGVYRSATGRLLPRLRRHGKPGG